MRKKSAVAESQKVSYSVDGESQPSFADLLHRYLGQKVAFLCARYHYRGILSVVGEDSVVLSNAVVIEVSGACAEAKAQNEDPVGGDIIIKYDAIEIVHQANFAMNTLPGEAETTR